uniref:rhombosortase n=1 Tax=Cellvibrio fontiphilus TaxID=1815559 RepID=UPI002B4C1008|nr:rhombosortase [Cellvibrio fontiphilus]
MTHKKISPCLLSASILAVFICGATLFQHSIFALLALYAEQVSAGEIWRLLSANLVHFGWVHTLMNLAALLLCVLAFFMETSVRKFLFLLLWCCAAVGVGIYFFNPEYQPYAGLSGALHGLIVAGLIGAGTYPWWIRAAGLLLVAAKLLQENSAGYVATDLQQLIPAAVAVESHVYGAIAGLVFATGNSLFGAMQKTEIRG